MDVTAARPQATAIGAKTLTANTAVVLNATRARKPRIARTLALA
jgi:hypothetical protein